jgi:hypothetical protein
MFLILFLMNFAGAINAYYETVHHDNFIYVNNSNLMHESHPDYWPTERSFRKRIYWMVKNNPLFYKLDVFQNNLDYYVGIITEHIKVLEAKIERKESCLSSNAMRITALVSVLAVIFNTAAYKHYGYSKTILNQSELYIGNTVVFSILGTLFSVATFFQGKKVYRYSERQVERLERDKQVLELLKVAKEEKEGIKVHSMADRIAGELKTSLSEVIINTINSVYAFE